MKRTTLPARLIFLGTGASSGVPVLGCSCSVCTSQNTKDKRMRASVLIQYNEKNYLIDAGPDIRQQLLQYNIRELQGLLITHTHYDHTGGLEEMRIFTFLQKKPMPCFLYEKHYEHIQKLFYYLFEDAGPIKNVTAKFDFTIVSEKTGFSVFEGLPIKYFSYHQGSMPVLGYRIGSLAYITDIKHYSETIFEELNYLDVLIISALRFNPSTIQFCVDEAVQFADRVRAKKTYFIHMSHDVEYRGLLERLPDTMEPAYDGQEIFFSI